MKTINSYLTAAILFVISSLSSNAQMISQVNLESYVKQQYGSNWEKTALGEVARYSLDNQGNMIFTKEIQAPNLTKNELYVEMANWFICNYDNSIQFADKEEGVLIARPYLENIARHAGGFNAYNISICPTVRAQISDGKVNISYTLRNYNVEVEKGGGTTATALGACVAAAAVTAAVVDAVSEPRYEHRTTYVDRHYGYGPFRHTTTTVYREYRPRHTFENALLLSCIASAATQAPSKDSKTWALTDCYPFVSKDKHRRASSKAFIMANAYSQVVMNNIEAAINQCSLAYAN